LSCISTTPKYYKRGIAIADRDLVDYIQECLDNGRTIESLQKEFSKSLLDNKTIREALDTAFKERRQIVVDETPDIETRPSPIIKYLFIFLLIVAFSCIPLLAYALNKNTLILSLWLLSAQILVGGVVIYVLMYFRAYTGHEPFIKCLFSSAMISIVNLTPLPGYLPNLVLLIGVIIVVFRIFFETDWRGAMAFFVIMFVLELSFIAVGVIITDPEVFDKMTPEKEGMCYSDPQQEAINIYEQGSITVDGQLYYDFCTTNKLLNHRSKVDYCDIGDCYLVKYSCHAEKRFLLFPCEKGCSKGACRN